MKSILFLPVLLCAIALPAFAELTPQDFDKIRLIVKDEVKAELSAAKQELKAEITAVSPELKTDITATHTRIGVLDTRLRNVEQSVAWIRGKVDSLDKRIKWLMALIVVAVAMPQIIIAWLSREDRAQERQIEELAREIEILKQQRIVSP